MQVGWVCAPFLVLIGAVLMSSLVLSGFVSDEDLRFWIGGSISAGVIGLQLSWVANAAANLSGWPARAVRCVLIDVLPSVGWVLLFALVAASGGIWIGNDWEDSREAGEGVWRTGQLSYGWLQVVVSPARLVPKADDPLKVCADTRTAVLVGRHEGTSFVLLRPTKDSDHPTEVLPLLDGDYAVATVTGDPQACNPKGP